MRKHKGKGPSSNQRLADGNQKEGSHGERPVTEKATKRTNRASVLFLVVWNMVRFAPRYAGRCSATPLSMAYLE